MGEDDEKRGDLDKALAKFTEAHRVTEALLARDPDNPDRIFGHAQSENRLGHLAYWQKDYEEAHYRTAQYKNLVAKLMVRPDKRADWVRHAGYSYGSDCARLIATKSQPKAALEECSQALRYIEELTKIIPDDLQAVSDLANRHAWLSDAYFANRETQKGFAHRKEQIRLVKALVERDPGNLNWLEQWAVTQMSYAELLLEHQRQMEADRYARNALAIAGQLVKHDPDNSKWKGWQKRTTKLMNEKE
jgi:tetratricopeptide (TPR) repeat protein